MKLLLAVLFSGIAGTAHAAATCDTAGTSIGDIPGFAGGRVTIPIDEFQKSWGSSDFLLPEVTDGDTTPGTAVIQRPKARLLPENISFMERGLWGESGLFRTLGIAGELTPESRKSELSARRTMLTMHQVGGFVTLGLMGASLYYGQRALDYSDRTDMNHHNQLVTYTIITYGLTGLLAVLSPPPLIRRDETSTTTIHKTLAWLHVAGMVLTPIVGSMVRKRSGRFSYTDLSTAHFHQISAYATTGVFAASLVIITF